MTSPTRLPRQKYSQNSVLSPINFFGGAGVGKSTTAALLFGNMKINGYKVELIHEVAKGYVWEDWSHIFGEQDWLFAHQHRLIRRLVGHDIDYAVVDSPILLSQFYMPDDFPQSFRTFVLDAFQSYDNINIFLERNPDLPYIQEGRNESEREAIIIDQQIRQYLTDHNIPYHRVVAGESAAKDCMDIVEQHRITKNF